MPSNLWAASSESTPKSSTMFSRLTAIHCATGVPLGRIPLKVMSFHRAGKCTRLSTYKSVDQAGNGRERQVCSVHRVRDQKRISRRQLYRPVSGIKKHICHCIDERWTFFNGHELRVRDGAEIVLRQCFEPVRQPAHSGNWPGQYGFQLRRAAKINCQPVCLLLHRQAL